MADAGKNMESVVTTCFAAAGAATAATGIYSAPKSQSNVTKDGSRDPRANCTLPRSGIQP